VSDCVFPVETGLDTACSVSALPFEGGTDEVCVMTLPGGGTGSSTTGIGGTVDMIDAVNEIFSQRISIPSRPKILMDQTTTADEETDNSNQSDEEIQQIETEEEVVQNSARMEDTPTKHKECASPLVSIHDNTHEEEVIVEEERGSSDDDDDVVVVYDSDCLEAEKGVEEDHDIAAEDSDEGYNSISGNNSSAYDNDGYQNVAATSHDSAQPEDEVIELDSSATNSHQGSNDDDDIVINGTLFDSSDESVTNEPTEDKVSADEVNDAEENIIAPGPYDVEATNDDKFCDEYNTIQNDGKGGSVEEKGNSDDSVVDVYDSDGPEVEKGAEKYTRIAVTGTTDQGHADGEDGDEGYNSMSVNSSAYDDASQN